MCPERKCGRMSGVSAESEGLGNLDSHVYRFPVGAMEAVVMRALQAAIEALRAVHVLRAFRAVPKAFKVVLRALKAVTGALHA
jgi:hypothetical protein